MAGADDNRARRGPPVRAGEGARRSAAAAHPAQALHTAAATGLDGRAARDRVPRPASLHGWWWAVALAGSIALAACSSETPKQKCTPGARVFCRCPDAVQTGLMQCLASGQAFGECLPCDPRASEPDIVDRRRVDAADPDSAGSDAGRADVAVDAAPDGAVVKCAPTVVPLTSSKDIVKEGNTSMAKATLSGLGACAVANVSKDIVYEVSVDERGRVTATLTPGAGYDPVLYARKGPCGTGDQLACADKNGNAGAEAVEVFVEAGDTFFLAVDGKSGSAGAYSLKLHLDPGSYCGDGTVDPEEACDDGNKASGDGCSSKCQPDGAPKSAQNCPGQTVHVWQLPVEFAATTEVNPNLHKATCGGGGGREAIYAVVPHRTGTLNVLASSDAFDLLLFARADPCLSGAELGCVNKVKGNGAETMAVPVESGKPFWLFVDGYKYGKGPFKLGMSMAD